MKLLFIFLFSLFFVTTANTKIVFDSDRDGNIEIYTMNDDGSYLRRVTNNPLRDERPLWSLDGKKIAFRRVGAQADRQVSDVMLMNINGSEIQTLLKNDEEFSSAYPVFFTRDEKELAILRWDLKALTVRLFLLELENGTMAPFRGVEDITDADISPDGRFIAFEKTPGFEKNIHIIGSDGRGEKPLLPPDPDPNVLLNRMYPRWAPDGRRLMFVESRLDVVEKEDEEGPFIDFVVKENNLLIHDIALENTERIPLPHGFRAVTPCWINDNEIIFSADATGLITKEHGNYDIYRYNLTSRSLTQLTTHLGRDLNPRWVAGTLEVSTKGKKNTQWALIKVDVHTQ